MASRDFVRAHLLSLQRMAWRLKAARRGNIAILTALLMAPIVGMMGLTLDYGHLILVKSRLDQAALAGASAAANAARNVVQTAPGRENDNYNQEDFNTKAINDGKKIGKDIFQAQFGSMEPTPTVTVERISNTFAAKVNYTYSINTYFAKYFNVSVFTVKGQQSMIVGISDIPIQSSRLGSIIDEKWNGSYSTDLTDPTKPAINDWYSGTPGSASPLSPTGGTLRKGVYTPPIGFSNFIQVGGKVNGATVAPIISKKVYLQAGNYELRYWYKSTTVYPEYEPLHICGSIGIEVRWAVSTVWRDGASTSTTPVSDATAQSSRAGVYLDPILGNPQLAATAPTFNSFTVPPAVPATANNQIDICVYSSRWIQRSIPLKITDSGYFWLSYVAEAPNQINPVLPNPVLPASVGAKILATQPNPTTHNGFYLGPVQLCQNVCDGLVAENSPWRDGTKLFEDEFSAPAASDGTAFNVTSGTTPAASGYEVILPYFFSDFFSDNVLPNTWVYHNASSQQRARAMVFNSALVRRLYLLPGVYRVNFEAQDGPTANGLPCDPVRAGSIVSAMRRGDYNQDRSGANTPSPPGYAPAATLSTTRTCSSFVSNFACFRIVTTHPYDFQLSTNKAIPEPVIFSGIQLRKLSVEVLSNNIKNSVSQSIIDSKCTSVITDGARTTTSESFETIPYARMWPGYTTLPLNRVTVTAPYP